MSYTSYAEFMRLGMLGDSLSDITGIEQICQDNQDSAQGEIDGYFRAGDIDLPLPTASVTLKIKQVEAAIGAYNVLCVIGFDPTSRANEHFRARYEDAISWLKDVAAGRTDPIPKDTTGATQDADPTTGQGEAAVVSESARGWGETWP
jgi:phage gp36-like protein